MGLFIVTQQRDDFTDTSYLGEKAFHRFPEDQETVSNGLPGKQHGPQLTRGRPPGPVTLEETHLHLEGKKGEMQGKKVRISNVKLQNYV